MMVEDKELEVKRAILAAALPGVAFDGWSWKTLKSAAVSAGLPVSAARRAFPGGPVELIDFFLAETDRQMLAVLEEMDLPSMRIRDRIGAAVQERLRLMAPHREAVRRAMLLLMRPGQGVRAARCLYRTVDAMWWAAGDTATDFNHYTKRGLLAGVYTSTLVYWLNDQSDDFVDTWAFLDRRIGDVMQIQKATGKLKGCRERLPTPWRALSMLRYGRSTGQSTPA